MTIRSNTKDGMQHKDVLILEENSLAKEKPTIISMVVVYRNCESVLFKALMSFKLSNIPSSDRELILINSMSSDRSEKIANDFAKDNHGHFCRILQTRNQNESLSAGWNLAIKMCNSLYMVRIDAHGTIKSDYCEKGIEFLNNNSNAFAVGGFLKTIPQKDTKVAIAISKIMSSSLSVGNSPFRVKKAHELPVEVDTAAYAIYVVSALKNVGGFDEKLLRTQDLDLHDRLLLTGKKIYFHPMMLGTYASTYNLENLAKKAFNTGYWVNVGKRARLRHLAPMCLVLYVILLPVLYFVLGSITFLPAIVYILILLFISIAVTASLLGGVATCVYHFSYGFGSISGMIERIKIRLRGRARKIT